jgi:hypothetical protein
MSSSGPVIGVIVVKKDTSVSTEFSCVYKKPEEMTTRAAEKRKRDAEQAELIPDDPVDEERDQECGGRGGRGGGRVARGERGGGRGRGISSAGRGAGRGAGNTEAGGTGGLTAGTGPQEARPAVPKSIRSRGAKRDKPTGGAGPSQTEHDEGGEGGDGKGALGAEEQAESGDSDQPLLTFGGGLTAAKKARRKSDKSGKGPAAKKGGTAEKGDVGKKSAKKRGGSKAGGASGQ